MFRKVFVFLLVLIIALSALMVMSSDESTVLLSSRINGVSLVNPHFVIDSAQMNAVRRVNGDWVAVIPFGFSRENEPEVHFNHERQWWGERLEGAEELIRLAHACGLKVMLKPHVWQRGSWIGEFDLDSEEKWKIWEGHYREYAMAYARLAEKMQVELFCIATEYKVAVVKRPAYWSQLIQDIKREYHGQLTYAANWDNYENVPFWDQMDYIGVDAYFPLVHEKDPDVATIKRAWAPLVSRLRSFGALYHKPILFAEYGYQSANGAVGNHWEVSQSADQVNMELQARAYQALYEVLWKEPWFAGGFFWKWHFDERHGGPQDLSFTPQGKPAEAVIARWYGTGISSPGR